MDKEQIKRIAEEAELTRDGQYPRGTRGRRVQRGVVMSVRLSEQEHADLLAAADSAGLPPSTLVRSLVQDYLGGRGPAQQVGSVRVSVSGGYSGSFTQSLYKATVARGRGRAKT